jgi:hypothetical protein
VKPRACTQPFLVSSRFNVRFCLSAPCNLCLSSLFSSLFSLLLLLSIQPPTSVCLDVFLSVSSTYYPIPSAEPSLQMTETAVSHPRFKSDAVHTIHSRFSSSAPSFLTSSAFSFQDHCSPYHPWPVFLLSTLITNIAAFQTPPPWRTSADDYAPQCRHITLLVFFFVFQVQSLYVAHQLSPIHHVPRSLVVGRELAVGRRTWPVAVWGAPTIPISRSLVVGHEHCHRPKDLACCCTDYPPFITFRGRWLSAVSLLSAEAVPLLLTLAHQLISYPRSEVAVVSIAVGRNTC